MLKLRVLCLVLLILVISSLCAEAQQQQNKRKRGSQKVQQQQNLNRPQNNKQKGNKINKVPIKNNKNRQEKPLKKVKDDVIQLIPGLGSVKGRTFKSEWSGKTIFQFLDIPYAKAPSGSLRFKAPVPVTPWSNVLSADKPHHGCPSLQDLVSYEALKAKKINVEDCLRLTVNTKSVTGNSPVMVYVHGDFLYDGSSLEAAPGYLLEEDVVLVSVRYRLGPFGFLSTMTDDIPGNAGVKDVVLALQWIQDHISAFGGDPTRVTLFGQVAGAALINVLTMSPAVPEGLFHRVIYHSASALSPAFITDNPLPSAKDIGKIAGCKTVNKVDSLNKCLRKLNATELLEAFNVHSTSKLSQGVGASGAVQFVVGGPSGILPQYPAKILTSGNFKAYPTMGGSVKNGGTFILRDIYTDIFNETIIDDTMNGIDYINLIISQTNGADPTEAWKKFAEEEVFTPEIIKNGTFHAMTPGLIDLCSTIAFKNPVLLALQGNAQKLPNSTYLYSFDYEGELNRYTTSDNADYDINEMPFDLGVSLTDDNLYLFPWPRFLLLNSNRDIKIAKRMVSFWTSFAATGKPSAPNVPKWPAMNDETGPYMKIGKTVSIGENYIDEFTAAVKENADGYNLVNEEFFDSLVDITENNEGDQNADQTETDNEEGRGNIVLIAKRTKKI
ncbi:Glutactin [Lucilia cuprina]|nr:Glutactin [Lucilia cuprina]